MNKADAQVNLLHFIFTENDFVLDTQYSTEDGWGREFAADKYGALYQMGFARKPEGLTATGNFLYLVADSFMKTLTSLPELWESNTKRFQE